jgi:hypothetical protein
VIAMGKWQIVRGFDAADDCDDNDTAKRQSTLIPTSP